MKLKKYLPAILFLASVIILYITSYPSIGWWDSGITAANAVNLSIPDPGSSILYIILGKFFTIIFFFLPKIKAVTLVSIFSTAGASVFLYYTMIEIIDNLKRNSSAAFKIPVSFFTALSLPFLYSIWIESNVSRIYSLGLFITSVLIFCSLKVWFSEDEHLKTKYFLLIIFLITVDYAAHRLNMPFIPVILLLLLIPLRRQILNYKFWLVIILLVAVGLSIHLYLFIRSVQNPPFYMDKISLFKELIGWITMKRYGESNFSIIFNRRAPFWSYQVNFMYLRYFIWNFGGTNGGNIFGIFAFFPLALGIVGFIYSLFKRIKLWTLIAIIFLFFSFGLIVYANIRAGFNEIREIDRLFLPSFFIFLLWCGTGLYLLAELISRLLTKINGSTSAVIFSVIAFAILPLNLLVTNWKACDNSDFYFPGDFAYNILSGCRKNAVVFTNGDNDTFSLMYLQSVEGYRKDVSVVNLPLLNTKFYVNENYNSKNGFKVDSVFLKGNVLPKKIEQPVKIILPFPGNLKMNLPPDTLKVIYGGRDFGKIKGMLIQDQVLISFLENNKWKRPVYFSSTVSQDNLLGLQNYLENEGMVMKLVPQKGDTINSSLMENNLLHVYKFRNYNNPAQFISAENSAISIGKMYRHIFFNLIDYYLKKDDKTKAKEIYNFMEDKLPDWRFHDKAIKHFPGLKE